MLDVNTGQLHAQTLFNRRVERTGMGRDSTLLNSVSSAIRSVSVSTRRGACLTHTVVHTVLSPGGWEETVEEEEGKRRRQGVAGGGLEWQPALGLE